MRLCCVSCCITDRRGTRQPQTDSTAGTGRLGSRGRSWKPLAVRAPESRRPSPSGRLPAIDVQTAGELRQRHSTSGRFGRMRAAEELAARLAPVFALRHDPDRENAWPVRRRQSARRKVKRDSTLSRSRESRNAWRRLQRGSAVLSATPRGTRTRSPPTVTRSCPRPGRRFPDRASRRGVSRSAPGRRSCGRTDRDAGRVSSLRATRG